MDTLSLDLTDATVAQAVMALQSTLGEHPGVELEILLGHDETIRHNLQRVLERHGRRVEALRNGSRWCLVVEAARRPVLVAAPAPAPAPAPLPPPVAPPVRVQPPVPPLLLLRSAFTPGDPALGRRLLLGVLQATGRDTPWIGLAHEAMELLEDPAAMQVLEGCQRRGVPVRLSRESLMFLGGDPGPFEILEDSLWQRLLGRGEINLV
nr:hypothetical protein [uncultured Holophaga sp.]